MTNTIYSGIKEGQDNDWAPTKNGFLQYETDLAMVRQMVDARVKTLPNEVDGYAGLDYWNIIFGQTPLMTKVRAVIQAIQTVPVVSQVMFVQSSWLSHDEGLLSMSFNIGTSLGDLKYQMTLDQSQKTISTEFV